MAEKVIVITGASAGIGAALAKQLAARGEKLVLAARREVELKKVSSDCGPDALSVVADVTQRADVEHVRDEAFRAFGHVDVWINNAGRGIGRQVLDLTDADFDEMMAVNTKSALYGMQTIVPHFRTRRRPFDQCVVCAWAYPVCQLSLSLLRGQSRPQQSDDQPAHGSARRISWHPCFGRHATHGKHGFRTQRFVWYADAARRIPTRKRRPDSRASRSGHCGSDRSSQAGTLHEPRSCRDGRALLCGCGRIRRGHEAILFMMPSRMISP